MERYSPGFQRQQILLLALLGILPWPAKAAGPQLATIYKHTSKKSPDSPYSDPLIYADGSLILSSYAGGKFGAGQIFELAPPTGRTTAWTYKDLYDFKGASDGMYPSGKLSQNSAGVVFGTTQYSAGGGGTIFSLAPPAGSSGWTETTVYNFSSSIGYPYSGVAVDGDGNLFGAAGTCGAGSYGCVFKYAPGKQGSSGNFTILHTFTGGNDGGYPDGALIIDNKGVIYGAAYQGGASGYGLVFSLSPKGNGTAWVETVIYDISDVGLGFRPASIIGTGDGKIYGVATYGGAYGGGAIFQLSPPKRKGGAWLPSTIASLDNTTGEQPLGELAFDAAGNFYGTAPIGGTYNYGAVFEISPPVQSGGSWTTSVIHTFQNKSDGGDYYDNEDYPGTFYGFGGVAIDGQGQIFGTTSLSVDPDTDVKSGTVFELIP